MSRLIVKNLPEKIKEDKFREIFSSVGGEITDLKLCFTRKGIFRKFGFVGYKTEEAAKGALKHLNNTFINTNKIAVEICKDFGDGNAPRAWSKYSKDSSAHLRKDKEVQDRLERIKKMQASPLKEIEKKKEKKKRGPKELEDVEGDSEFQEFLAVQTGKNQIWTNEILAPDASKEVAMETKNIKKKEKVVEMEGASDSSDDESEPNKQHIEKKEEQDEGDENKQNVVKVEEEKKKSVSDLDWIKSKVTKTEGESSATTESTNEERNSSQSEDEMEEDVKDEEGDAEEESKKDKDEKSKKKKKETKVMIKKEEAKCRTLKMRGIPFKCTEEDVVLFFKPTSIDDIRFPQDKKGRPSGYAFVDFTTLKDAVEAMKRDGKKLKGRYVELFPENQQKKPATGNKKYGKDGEWLDKSDEPVEDIADSGRLFIRNLCYTCTEEDLQDLFKKYGPLTEIQLPIDKNNNKTTGYAFVTFMMPEHAVSAISELDGTIFQGRLLHLLPGRAQKTKQEESGNSGDMTSSYKKQKEAEQKTLSGSSHNWNALFLGANAVADVMAERLKTTKKDLLSEGAGSVAVRMALGETELVSETRDFLESHGVKLDVFGQANTARSKSILLVKNLPPGTTTRELNEIFTKHGDLGRLLMPPFGITAIVEYVNPPEAKSAFTNLAYSKFKHVPLYLEWAPVDILSGEVTAKPESEDNSDEESDEEEADVEGTTIFVKNLNFSTTDDKLKEVFQKCGKLRRVTVAKKKDPKKVGQMLSMGYGFVEYKKKSDADKAIKFLQNVDLEGHKLELKVSHRETTATKSSRKRASEKEQTTSKIVVRNIPFEATEKEIKELFSSFGHIKSVRLPKKMAGTGTHRGFAFVDFTTKQEAKTAFKALCQSTHLYGRRLVLEWAEEDDSIALLQQKTAKHYREEPQAKKTKADLLSTLGSTPSNEL